MTRSTQSSSDDPDAQSGFCSSYGVWPWCLVLGLLILAIVLTLGVKLRWALEPDFDELAQVAGDCRLEAHACVARFADGGEVRLQITPAGIPLLKPLTLQVWLTGLPAPERVQVDFKGLNMDMGVNRSTLAPGGDNGLYVGEAILPVCASARMHWEARVLLFADDRLRAAAFRFETRRR